MSFFDPVPAIAGDIDHQPLDEPLVTVSTYNDPALAHVDRVILEQVGLTPVIADGNIVAMDWLYANAVGGVKLQVPRSQLEQARNTLAAPSAIPVDEGADADPLPIHVCAQCGSTEVYRVTTGTTPFFLGFVLLGIPFLFYRRRLECELCGHQWREK